MSRNAFVDGILNNVIYALHTISIRTQHYLHLYIHTHIQTHIHPKIHKSTTPTYCFAETRNLEQGGRGDVLPRGATSAIADGLEAMAVDILNGI